LASSRIAIINSTFQTTESSTTEIPDIVNEDFENFFCTNLLPDDDVVTNGTDSPEADEKFDFDTPAWLDDEIELSKVKSFD